MKKLLFFIPIILLAMGCSQKATYTYPDTAKGDVVDNYHGTEVPDPYRWLEDDMSDETAAWVKAQNDVTFSYLESIPFRDALKKRMTEIWNYPRMSTPFKEGERYFYFYNTGLQNQDIMYVKTGPG
jgi:prolyl oligopeptidase